MTAIVWDDRSSNKEQQYLTHGAFRYFGKLHPSLTARILNEVGLSESQHLVDLMCGSGTTLLEGLLKGASVTGIDSNDLSVMIARAKITPIGKARLSRLMSDVALALAKVPGKGENSNIQSVINSVRSNIRNFDRWFDRESASQLARIRLFIENCAPSASRDLATVAFASVVRASSNASIRTGRIFYDRDKKLRDPVTLFIAKLSKLVESVGILSNSIDSNIERRVIIGDSRLSTGLPSEMADVIFLHPPYFALYRYSSDVLRFEISWCGLKRASIADREIEDGFKTSDETLVVKHVSDLAAVIREGARLCRDDGKLAIVTSDTTLRKELLPVIDPLINAANEAGFALERRIRRKINFAQASYHRSADGNIVRPDDEVLFFNKVSQTERKE